MKAWNTKFWRFSATLGSASSKKIHFWQIWGRLKKKISWWGGQFFPETQSVTTPQTKTKKGQKTLSVPCQRKLSWACFGLTNNKPVEDFLSVKNECVSDVKLLSEVCPEKWECTAHDRISKRAPGFHISSESVRTEGPSDPIHSFRVFSDFTALCLKFFESGVADNNATTDSATGRSGDRSNAAPKLCRRNPPEAASRRPMATRNRTTCQGGCASLRDRRETLRTPSWHRASNHPLLPRNWRGPWKFSIFQAKTPKKKIAIFGTSQGGREGRTCPQRLGPEPSSPRGVGWSGPPLPPTSKPKVEIYHFKKKFKSGHKHHCQSTFGYVYLPNKIGDVISYWG